MGKIVNIEVADNPTSTKSTDAAAFLKLLHPSGVFEVCAYDCPLFPGARKTMTVSGYFDNHAAAAKAALWIDKKFSPPGVYATLNPVPSDFLARAANRVKEKAEHRTKDEHITRRNWLFFDIDPVKPAGMSATNEEANAAIRLASELRYELNRLGWPEPLRCMSGNGAYLLYRVDLPNDDESTNLAKSILHSLAARFDTPAAHIDCNTYNAARVLKIPGTTARKGDSIPTRPHRMAYFIQPEQAE